MAWNSMAVDSDKYYPREINAAARENSRGGRPRETFRPARLFLHPRETFSSRKRVASLEDKREHVPSKCLIVKEASENSAAARARNPTRRFRARLCRVPAAPCRARLELKPPPRPGCTVNTLSYRALPRQILFILGCDPLTLQARRGCRSWHDSLSGVVRRLADVIDGPCKPWLARPITYVINLLTTRPQAVSVLGAPQGALSRSRQIKWSPCLPVSVRILATADYMLMTT